MSDSFIYRRMSTDSGVSLWLAAVESLGANNVGLLATIMEV